MKRLTRRCKQALNDKMTRFKNFIEIALSEMEYHEKGNFSTQSTYDIYETNKLYPMADKLAAYEDAEQNGLLMQLPCKLGATVYVITTCKNIPQVLDGSLYGTATGYYCPYELNDKCPYIGGEDCMEVEDKLTVFEDTVASFTYDERGTFIHTRLTGFYAELGNGVYLTKEEADKALKESEGIDGE